MSTRGVIAREINAHLGKFEGRYHHSDSYPSGLGKQLQNLYLGHFKKDLNAMLKFLIDDHPAGWSSIINSDFNLQPGFINMERLSYLLDNRLPFPPRCYCHGDRKEEENIITEKSIDSWCEYAYVFLKDKPAMIILILEYEKGWRFLTEVDLNKQIKWKEIEKLINHASIT